MVCSCLERCLAVGIHMVHNLIIMYSIRYDFVRQLRSRIDTALTPLIDKKLERLAGREGDRNSSIPAITEEIIASSE